MSKSNARSYARNNTASNTNTNTKCISIINNNIVNIDKTKLT
jgi:hypothetical protein